MALTRLTNFNFQQALEMYKAAGSAQRLYEHRNDIGDLIEGCTPRLIAALKDWGDAMKRNLSCSIWRNTKFAPLR